MPLHHGQWTSQEKNAFEASKELLAAPRVLVHYDPQLPLVLACNTSPYGLGAVLAHCYSDGSEKPVASYSFSGRKELLSNWEGGTGLCVRGNAVSFVPLWSHLHFSYWSQPTTEFFGTKKPVPPQASGWIQWWVLTLSMYDYTLIHKKPAKHGNADALSWLPLLESISSTPIPADTVLLLDQMNEMPVTAEDIKTWTRRDPIFSRVLQFTQHGWSARLRATEESLRPYWSNQMELSSQSGCLCGEGELMFQRLVYPKCCRNCMRLILDQLGWKGLPKPWSGDKGWTKILKREFKYGVSE